MAIHVQDEETDWLVRDFARRRGVGITAAIKLAIQEASSRERDGLEDLKRKVRPIIDEIKARSKRDFDPQEDKAFMDEMWGEDS